MLGKLYLTGQSVQPDQVQAIVWFGRSAEGNQYAQFFLERHDEMCIRDRYNIGTVGGFLLQS